MTMRQRRQPVRDTQVKVHGSFSLWKSSCPSLTDAYRTGIKFGISRTYATPRRQ